MKKIFQKVEKKKVIGVLIIIFVPGGFIVGALWMVKIIYKKPISIKMILDLFVESFDFLPKVENPMKIFSENFLESWVFSGFFYWFISYLDYLVLW